MYSHGSSDLQSVIRSVVDVLIVAYLIYRGLLLIRGTRAFPMLWGLTVIVLLYFISAPVGLVTLGWILGNFLSSIILVVVVIFQDEIRRVLTKMGTQRLFRDARGNGFDKVVEDITLVSTKLAKAKIGALIVIQREVGLDDLIEDAVVINSEVNRKLLMSIFVKDSPLHDGAVIIEGDRIKAAGCVLPLSFNPDLDPSLGTRHRAALGLSERSDALVIVVSEENSSITLARDGGLIRNLDGSMLRDALLRYMIPEPVSQEALPDV